VKLNYSIRALAVRYKMKILLLASLAINILLGCYSAGAYQAKHEILPPADIVIPQPKGK